jgi:hypothetical protein
VIGGDTHGVREEISLIGWRTFIQVCRGRVQGKEQRGNKGITTICVRLGYLLFCIIPEVGHYPRI